MNKTFATTIAFAALFATSASFAASQPASGEFSAVSHASAPSTVSRAVVRAQLLDAAQKSVRPANGEIADTTATPNATPARSRAEVLAEARSAALARSHASGEFAI